MPALLADHRKCLGHYRLRGVLDLDEGAVYNDES